MITKARKDESTKAIVQSELAGAMRRLRDAGVEFPQLDAQLLMARALGVSRLDVVAHPERILSDLQRDAFRKMLDRRALRYPLAYILGEKEFYGLTFEVNARVLIPRPETEILVEQVRDRVGKGARIADIGTGSGAIAVALAVNLSDARIWATDTSEEALKVARANTEKHAVAERVSMVRGDLLKPLLATGLCFDAVVSNPPYIPSAVIETLESELRYEPIGALDGGPDGLDAYRALFPQAIGLTDMVAVEFGIWQAASITEIARAAGFGDVRIIRDLAGIERVAIARR